MFKMALNQADGVLLLSYSGTFTFYDAMLFYHELHSSIQAIMPEEYVLVLDAQDIKAATPDLIPLLNEIKRLYTDAPFQSIFAVESDLRISPRPSAATATASPYKDHIHKVEGGRGNWSCVDSIEEALRLVRVRRKFRS